MDLEPAADKPPGLIPPEIIKRVSPEYPEKAKDERIAGTVSLEAVIGVDGKAHDIKIIHSLKYMDEVIMEAVKQWEFKPAIWNGRPVETSFVFMMNIPEKR